MLRPKPPATELLTAYNQANFPNSAGIMLTFPPRATDTVVFRFARSDAAHMLGEDQLHCRIEYGNLGAARIPPISGTVPSTNGVYVGRPGITVADATVVVRAFAVYTFRVGSSCAAAIYR